MLRFVNGTWTSPKTLYNDNWKINGCPVNGPRAASIENTLVVAWFAAPNETSQVNVIFSEDAGEHFLKPIKVDLGNPNGRVDVDLINEQIDIYRSISREEIQSVAQKYLSPNQRVEIEYLPGEEIGEE